MKILLTDDDSIYSEAACDALLARIWPPKSNFKIISVLDESEAPKSTQSGLSSEGGATLPGSLEAVQQLLKRISAQLQQKFPDADVTHEILYGNSKDKILDCATKWSANLIVAGSHGRTGLTRILLGSVSQTILLYGQCSTLIVRLPKSEQEVNDTNKSPQRVLIPLDLSEHSQKALDWVLSLEWGDECKFKILTVLPPLADKFSDGLALLQDEALSAERVRFRNEAQQLVDDSKARLAQKYGTERISADLLEGDVGETILTKANSWPASLIVMGTRGHGWLKRLWLGSTSQEVVLQAPCSVEVVKRNPT